MIAGSPNDAQLAAAEAAEKALHAGEADLVIITACSASTVTPAPWRMRADLLGLAAFIIVVAEHGDDRDRAGAQILGEDLGLAGLAEIGEVAAQSAARPQPREISANRSR